MTNNQLFFIKKNLTYPPAQLSSRKIDLDFYFLFRSLGVLLYTLVYGAMPFDGSNFKRLVKQITTGDYYEPKKPAGNAAQLYSSVSATFWEV